MDRYKSVAVPILVGGKKQVVIPASNVPVELSSVNTSDMIGFSCRSMLINAHGVHGTLYRIGECLIILHNDEEVVIKATDYFGVFHCNQYCSFVKGMLFEFDGHVHDYSGSPFLVPLTVEKVYSSQSILS